MSPTTGACAEMAMQWPAATASVAACLAFVGIVWAIAWFGRGKLTETNDDESPRA